MNKFKLSLVCVAFLCGTHSFADELNDNVINEELEKNTQQAIINSDDYLSSLISKKQEVKRLKELLPAYNTSNMQLGMKKQIAQDYYNNYNDWVAYRTKELENAKSNTLVTSNQIQADKKSLQEANEKLNLLSPDNEVERKIWMDKISSFEQAIAKNENILKQKQAKEQYLEKLLEETKKDRDVAGKQVAILENMISENKDFMENKEVEKARLEEKIVNLVKEIEELNKKIVDKSPQAQKTKNRLEKILVANSKNDINELLILQAALEKENLVEQESKGIEDRIKTIADKIASDVLQTKLNDVNTDMVANVNIQLNNMNKRLGEVRGLDGEYGFWLRSYGGKMSYENNSFNYFATQFGADKIHQTSSGDFIAGFLMGFDKANANTKSKSFSGGVYLSYIFNNNFFIDSTFKYVRTSYDKQGYDLKNQNAFLVSLEGGYRAELSNDFYLEPSFEIISGYVGKYEQNKNETNEKISINAKNPLILKPQFFAGYIVDDFTFRAGVGGVFDTKKDKVHYKIGDIVKGIDANSTATLERDTHGFASVGSSYKISNNSRFNISLERSFGGKLKNDYEINATIRCAF